MLQVTDICDGIRAPGGVERVLRALVVHVGDVVGRIDATEERLARIEANQELLLDSLRKVLVRLEVS